MLVKEKKNKDLKGNFHSTKILSYKGVTIRKQLVLSKDNYSQQEQLEIFS